MQKPIRYQEVIFSVHDPDAYWCFLFHGFGADASDLKNLSDYLTPSNKKINWIFPEGIYSVPIGPMMSGRAWWPLTLSQLPSDWSDYSPDNLETLKVQIWNMINSFKIPWNRIIIGGFSQGAMLATELYLSAAEKPAGLISFSGSLIRKSAWTEYLKYRAGAKVFLSHGEQDQVLPASGTNKLLSLFKTHQLDCTFSSFKGGHEIPLATLQKAQSYLSGLA
jgi:phospholipase/carboxylesterase